MPISPAQRSNAVKPARVIGSVFGNVFRGPRSNVRLPICRPVYQPCACSVQSTNDDTVGCADGNGDGERERVKERSELQGVLVRCSPTLVAELSTLVSGDILLNITELFALRSWMVVNPRPNNQSTSISFLIES